MSLPVNGNWVSGGAAVEMATGAATGAATGVGAGGWVLPETGGGTDGWVVVVVVVGGSVVVVVVGGSVVVVVVGGSQFSLGMVCWKPRFGTNGGPW